MRILIVEDEPTSLRVEAGILQKEGYEISTATDVRHAMAVLENDPHVDLIVLDIMMPKVDGLQFLRYLKSTLRFSKIPVIMCTALHDISSVTKSLEHGAIDYAVKPVDGAVLKGKVAKALEQGVGSVLIVCEDKVEMGILVRTIDREGFHCLTCAHGEDAWNMIESKKIAVVIAELLLPGISGFELLVRIKEKYPKLPVVLVADSHAERAREEIIAAGADGYLVKPFTNTEITRRIASLVK